MDLKNLVASLHVLERKVLPYLEKYSTPEQLTEVSGLKDVEVIRALQWLQNKEVITLQSELKELAFLESNGKEYSAKGLPEKRILEALKEKELSLQELAKKTSLSNDEINGTLGVLRSKAAIEIKKDKEIIVKLTAQGKQLLNKDLPEEKFLKKSFPLDLKDLTNDEKLILESLKKRKNIISTAVKTSRALKLTDLGKKLLKEKISDDLIDRVTPQLLRTGDWQNKEFRRFDVEVNVPKISAGKYQHYRKFLDSVRQKLMNLGFTEMTGPIVETDFWDMDALFMPQFHSARDIHEAYYIKDPKQMEIPPDVLKRVKEAHENGGSTGGKGWQYKFDIERTKRTLLRTQGTACSARMLASKDLKIPGKYFGLTRCFRYDVIDATHLPDFNQTEGIVVEDGLNLRHLFGLLKMFAKEFAETEEVKIVPGYFPFTEPSAELFAKHPQLGWIELGGAGILRPEVVQPLLGKKVSVLAWGLGVDRLGMFKLGIKDIRSLFSHDLEFLRNTKVI